MVTDGHWSCLAQKIDHQIQQLGWACECNSGPLGGLSDIFHILYIMQNNFQGSYFLPQRKPIVIVNPLTPKISLVILLYCLPSSSSDISLENVVLDQLIIPGGYFPLFPSIVCFILYWYCREKLCLVTHGSQTVNATRTLTLRSVSTKCKPQSISATLWYAIRIIFFL